MTDIGELWGNEPDRRLVADVDRLIDEGKLEEACALIDLRLSTLKDDAAHSVLAAILASFLIDIGSIGFLEQPAHVGISLVEANLNAWSKFFERGTLEYNLGNGKGALFHCRRLAPGFRYSAENIDLLIESKNHYWKSYRLGTFSPAELFVNLGSALDECWRVPEAIGWYNQAIQHDATHAMAHLNRAISLNSLGRISNNWTLALGFSALQSCRVALHSGDLSEQNAQRAAGVMMQIEAIIQSTGTPEQEIRSHVESAQRSAIERLSPFRRFCIDQQLALCEHALYCCCEGARRDDLSILQFVCAIKNISRA